MFYFLPSISQDLQFTVVPFITMACGIYTCREWQMHADHLQTTFKKGCVEEWGKEERQGREREREDERRVKAKGNQVCAASPVPQFAM